MALADPATKDDLDRLDKKLDTMRDKLFEHMDQKRLELKEEMSKITKELKEYFDFTAENIRYDFVGAHKDSVEVLKDKIHDHEERISSLELRPKQKRTMAA